MLSEMVSIIIPVYNVINYLDCCVQSVLKQSYADLEIILVDDGSTDGSSQICDHWAEKDPRVQVIHKENGGLSSARNAGIESAIGEYLAFVDSDDYISPEMIQKLHEALKANNAEISVCSFLHVDEQGTPIEGMNHNLSLTDKVFSGKEAVSFLQLGQKGYRFEYAWNKLYSTALFSDRRFPEGKLCEDAFLSHRLLGESQRVACIHDICYYYRQRGGSIMHSGSPYVYLHQAEARVDRMQYCSELGLHRCAGSAYWRAAMYLCSAVQLGDHSPALQGEIADVLRSLRKSTFLLQYCTEKEKLQVLMTCLSPRLYCALFRGAKRQQRKMLLKK